MHGHITVNNILRNFFFFFKRKYVCIKVCKSCYISYLDYRNKNSELYITKI